MQPMRGLTERVLVNIAKIRRKSPAQAELSHGDKENKVFKLLKQKAGALCSKTKDTTLKTGSNHVLWNTCTHDTAHN